MQLRSGKEVKVALGQRTSQRRMRQDVAGDSNPLKAVRSLAGDFQQQLGDIIRCLQLQS